MIQSKKTICEKKLKEGIMTKFEERKLVDGKPVEHNSQDLELELNSKKDRVKPETQNMEHNIKKEALGPNIKR